MRALVVYESMFGNTKVIAEAIAEGLAAGVEVDLAEVGTGPEPQNVDLLVAGGPTHAFGMSRASTRRSAAEQAKGPLVSRGIGLREWLESLPSATPRTAVATFDTRVRTPRLPGSAARAAEKRLGRLGYRIAAPAESFYVDGTEGPLLEGERERARRWGEAIGLRLAGRPVAAAGREDR